MTPARGRPPRRAVAACVLLALAGHAALLWHAASSPPGSSAGARPGDTGTAPLIHVNLVRTMAPPVQATDVAEAALPDAPASQPVLEKNTGPGSDLAGEPQFAAPPADLGLPDAVLPGDGVQVRAHLRVDADGQVQAISTAALPVDAPPAFQESAQRALADARLAPAGAPRAHCLQLDFKPGATAPHWSWRTEASAARCLGSRAGTARPLPTPP